MKKIISIILIICFMFCFCSCGDPKFIDGKEYETYGLLNSNTAKNDDIQYELITGNVVWGIILIETVIAPIYFFGFSIYEPICKKSDFEKGVISNS